MILKAQPSKRLFWNMTTSDELSELITDNCKKKTETPRKSTGPLVKQTWLSVQCYSSLF